MALDDRINDNGVILKKCEPCSFKEKKIFESILDILQDIID